MYSYFDSLSPKQARNYGYSYFPAPSGRRTAQALSPEVEEELLRQVESRSVPAAELLFDAVDTPASYLRDVLAGVPLGSGTTSGQALDAYSIRPSEDALGGWGRPLAEFAFGATLDPLNLVGVGGMNKAAKVARGVSLAGGRNLLDDASRVMSRRLIQNQDLGGAFAQNALNTWQDIGKGVDDLTDPDLIARPLAGSRRARRELTLDDLVQAQDQAAQPEIIKSIENQLGKGQQYGDLAKQTLRYDVGLGLPFSDYSSIGFNIPGGGKLASGLDRLGQIARWSGPGRQLYAAFDKDTFGATEEAGQIIGKEAATAIRAADEKSGAEIQEILGKLLPDAFNDADLSKRVRRILTNSTKGADLDLVTPGAAGFRQDIKDFVDSWSATGGLRDQFLDRRAEAGLSSKLWESRFGSKYFPRRIDDLSFLSKIEDRMATGAARHSKGAGSGRALGTTTADQLPRKRFMDVPGAEDTLNRLSLDTNVAGPNRTKITDDAAAQYIKDQIDQEIARRFPLQNVGGKQVRLMPNGQEVPQYRLSSAKALARVLHQVDENSIKSGLPIFGSHFADDLRRYVRGNERAMAVANVMYDFMGGTAKNIPSGKVNQGGHIPLSNAVKALGLKTIDNRKLIGPLAQTGAPKNTMLFAGAAEQLLSRLSARFPNAAQEMKGFSLDKRMLERLTRVADFYDYPQVQKGWIKMWDDFTRIWKGSILAFPARFTRDWYSGGFSNAVEVGVGSDLVRGYAGAKYLIQGQFDRLDEILNQMPRYKRLTNALDRKNLFERDLASSGLLGGRRSVDLADAANTMQSGVDVADELMPGMNPRTTVGYQIGDALKGRTPLGADKAAYSELAGDWTKFAETGWVRPRDVGNPILRWSQKLGDTTDSINRAAGYMGLLLKGIDPLEAARRMKAAHVDYSSLTTFERNTMRRFIPFWSYTSRIGKWLATKLYENPGGRFTQFGLRAPDAILSRDEEYTPESIRANYGMPVSPGLARPFGKQSEGATPWLTDIDLPGIDTLNMFRPGFRAGGTLDLSQTGWNTVLDFAGRSLHPVVRAGVEAGTGMNLYTKRPKKDFTPAINEILRPIIPPESMYGQWIKTVAPAIDLIPFASRPMQIANRLMDEEKIPDLRDRIYQMGVNAFTGVKFQNVSPEARRIDIRRKIGEMAQEDPLIRSMTQPWVPDEAMPYVDPMMLDLLDLDRQMARESSAERMAREGRPAARRTRSRQTDPLSYFE